MSMHLAGPGLTTTSTRKRKEKITKAKQAELEQGWRERNVRLKDMGLAKESLEQYTEWVYGRGKKTKSKNPDWPVCKTTSQRESNSNRTQTMGEEYGTITPRQRGLAPLPKHVVTDGGCTKKPAPVYTGSKMIGVATMHKSNMVPVFSDEEVVDIARMRR